MVNLLPTTSYNLRYNFCGMTPATVEQQQHQNNGSCRKQNKTVRQSCRPSNLDSNNVGQVDHLIIMPPVQRSGAAEKTIIANNSNTNNGTIIGRSTSRSTTTAAAVAGTAASSVNKQSNLSSLGDASGVAILLGNHAKFGFAERCW